MNNFRKAVEALERLASKADKLVPLVLSFAIFAAIIVIGLQQGLGK
ncbi:hypothetical protein [Pseudomonas paracarnis]|jgi:hypothetical protein|nr:hypothetical protein [Pseudomonas paracarnis]MBW9244502.1 hypothetical protein [Pseudomonas paracarnis]